MNDLPQLFGGPMDGMIVPPSLLENEWLEFETILSLHANNYALLRARYYKVDSDTWTYIESVVK